MTLKYGAATVRPMLNMSDMTDDELRDEIDRLVNQAESMALAVVDDEAMAQLMRVESTIAVYQAEQRRRSEREIIRQLERIVDRLSN